MPGDLALHAQGPALHVVGDSISMQAAFIAGSLCRLIGRAPTRNGDRDVSHTSS